MARHLGGRRHGSRHVCVGFRRSNPRAQYRPASREDRPCPIRRYTGKHTIIHLEQRVSGSGEALFRGCPRLDSIDGARSDSGASYERKHYQPRRERQSGYVDRGSGAAIGRGDYRDTRQQGASSGQADEAGYHRGGRGDVRNLRRKLLRNEPGLAARRWDGRASAPTVSTLRAAGCGPVPEEPSSLVFAGCASVFVGETGGSRRYAHSAQQCVGLRDRVPCAPASYLEWTLADVPHP